MEHPTPLTLHPLDYAVIAVYLLALASIGVRHAGRQRDLAEYYLAGRSVRWFVLGASLMAAVNSGSDYIMQPSNMAKFGAVMIAQNLAWLIAFPYVCFVIVPFYRRLGVFSIYEYMEIRFDPRVRTLVAGFFIVWRLAWVASALYVPALALSVAMGQVDRLPLVIGLLGLLASVYTAAGGIRTVIWTDTLQFFVMFGGAALAVVFVLLRVDGGAGAIVAALGEIGDPATALPTAGIDQEGIGGALARYLTTTASISVFVIASVLARAQVYTTDQMAVQRLQTASSVREARKGLAIVALADVVWMLALSFVGLALVVYFRNEAGEMPGWALERPDLVFPSFIAEVFPPVLTGLVIAAILAASLSSMDAGINAISAVFMVDFYGRFHLKGAPEASLSDDQRRAQLRASRLATLAAGSGAILFAWGISGAGSIFEYLTRVVGGFGSPILGLFLLGMFSRRVDGRSALVGGVGAYVLTQLLVHQKAVYAISNEWLGTRLDPGATLAFVWPPVFGVALTMIGGWLVSRIRGGQAPSRWSWRAVVFERQGEERKEPSAESDGPAGREDQSSSR